VVAGLNSYNTSFRDARASLGRWGDHPVYGAGPTLETLASGLESPRLVTPELVEGQTLARLPLSGPPLVGFSAFLNGIQQSRVVLHAGLVPVVHGTTAAVIRVRRDRRLTTHDAGPRIERGLFAPHALVSPELWADLTALGVTDTSPTDAHPATLLDRAVHVVQRRREAAERALAESWADDALLWIDGALPAASRRAVGVVRTHRTLYAAPEALATICALAPGERSSMFRPPERSVVSWYVRLRDPVGRHPLWGLLRVEVADADPARADLVSRWVMAEATPLALPDPRWDTLVYGVRDCEEYLRAIC
jgi:hypothetical protein